MLAAANMVVGKTGLCAVGRGAHRPEVAVIIFIIPVTSMAVCMFPCASPAHLFVRVRVRVLRSLVL